MSSQDPRDDFGRSDALPVSALLALAMTGFICIATETLPAGLLPQISTDLKLSTSSAGQMVTAYALGSLLSAIPLTMAISHWRRRSALLLAVVGFLVFNTVTAVSSIYAITLAARFLAGCAAGLAWSLIATYARRMVTPRLQGKAVAIAMIGTPIALAIGVPLGTWLGSSLGWRPTFGIMSAFAAVLLGWVLAQVPDFAGHKSRHVPLATTLRVPGVLPILSVVLTWMLAHNILYTYIAPFVAPAGLAGRTDFVLLVFGVAALLGIWLTGVLVDKALRATVLASISTFAIVALCFAIAPSSPTTILVGVAVWGLTFGGAATLIQTALADAAGDHADLALSMNVVAWNLAIAGGGVFGGVLVRWFGARSFPPALFILLLVAFAIAWRACDSGFPAGRRKTSGSVVPVNG